MEKQNVYRLRLLKAFDMMTKIFDIYGLESSRDFSAMYYQQFKDGDLDWFEDGDFIRFLATSAIHLITENKRDQFFERVVCDFHNVSTSDIYDYIVEIVLLL